VSAGLGKGVWLRSGPLVRAGLISYDAEAIRSLNVGEQSLKKVSK
jgi:hypothetical protein